MGAIPQSMKYSHQPLFYHQRPIFVHQGGHAISEPQGSFCLLDRPRALLNLRILPPQVQGMLASTLKVVGLLLS